MIQASTRRTMTSMLRVIIPAFILIQHLCLLFSSRISLFLSRWICNLKITQSLYILQKLLYLLSTKDFISTSKALMNFMYGNRFSWKVDMKQHLCYVPAALQHLCYLQGEDHTLSETLRSPNTPSLQLRGTLSSSISSITRTIKYESQTWWSSWNCL